MRLICPNCDAQYEVPENVMPLHGRDVQCSSCGQTWFQEHPNAPKDLVFDEEDDDLPETPERPLPDGPQETLPADEVGFGSAKGTAQAPPHPVRRALDPAVEDVLRAEAELEAKARKAERSSLESQPDLGLSDAPQRRSTAASADAARPKPAPASTGKEDVQFAKAASAVVSSRRELLPDIEEINSTLRSNSDRSPATDPGQTAQVEVQEKRSSRRGFVLTVALVAVLTLIYIYAPELAQRVPEAEQALTRYVEIVDSARVWLDTQITTGLSWLDQISGDGGA